MPNTPQFLPDWTRVWTATEAEEQLNGFEFTGPGWYIGKETILVIPVEAYVRLTVWRQRWPASTKFNFYVFSGNPRDAFNAITTAPVRKDDSV